MNNLEKAAKRKTTSKGRVSRKILAVATPSELVKADMAFGRTAITWADFENLALVYARKDERQISL